MTKLAVHGPFDEGDVHGDLRTDPVGALAREADGLRERRLRDLEPVETLAQIQQQPGVETGADLAGEHELLLLEVANEEGAEPDAPSLRVGESADDEVLRGLALHLQPVRRPAVLVW